MAEPQDKIRSFCKNLSEILSDISDEKEIIDCVMEEIPKLIVQKEVFAGVLHNVIKDAEYPDCRNATMFDNELLLYSAPRRSYSLRLFLWSPKKYTQVHDHSSWGVIGPVSGELEVVDYERKDDRSNPEYASLREKGKLRLMPSETAFTLPLDEGIHKVGNPTAETVLSLSLYGSPLARGYINEFDVESCRVRKIISQRTKKKLLSIQALTGIDRRAAEEAFNKVRNHPLEVIRAECLEAEQNLKKGNKNMRGEI